MLVCQSSHVYQDCTNNVPTVYQSWKTVKNSQNTVKTAKMTIGVPIVTCLPRLYQQCTNCQKQSKTGKQQKNDHWCTNRHMSTQSLSNTQSRVISAWNDLPVGLTVDSSYVGLQSKVLIESANLIFSKYSFTCYGSPTSCCYWLSCARAYARR